jgi:long-chain fatty acid transport protein
VISACVVCAFAGVAHAGGETFPDNGAQSIGRGGAFAAKADDGTALEYNLGGLAFQRGTRLTASVNLVGAFVDFTRAGSYSVPGAGYDGAPFPKVSNSGGVFPVPFFAASSDFGTDRFVGAVGVFGPSAYGQLKFPSFVTVNGQQAPAPQRYDFVSEDLLVAFPTVAASYRVLDNLAFGAAFHWVYSNIQFNQVAALPLGMPLCKSAEDPTCDVAVALKVSQGFAPSGSFGVMWHATPEWHFGANLRLPTSIEATGTVKPQVDPNFPLKPTFPPGRSDGDAKIVTGQPMVIHYGARYRFLKGGFEQGDIELDGDYQRWSSELKNITVTLSGIMPAPSMPIAVLHNWDDTYSVRMGGAYNIQQENGNVLTMRAGLYYDSAAAPIKDTRLDFIAWDRIGFSLGFGYTIGSLTLAGGGSYSFLPQRQVTMSEVKQTNGLLGGSTSQVVGNGTFDAKFLMLTLGAEYVFGATR